MMRKVEGEKMGSEMVGTPTKQMMMPSMHLEHKTLPEGKDWKVGKMYAMKLHVKMTGMNMRKGSDDKEHGGSDFEIHGIETGKEVKGKVERYT